jgi:NAD(P)H-dependent FMN reductase
VSKIACIVGNRRPNNYTAKALAVVSTALEGRGATVTTIDGTKLDLAFPGEPETEDAKELKKTIIESDAVVFATPEYHGTFSAYAKIIIENLGYPSVLKGKPLALLGVASGRIGAIKSLEHMRSTCAHIGAIVMPGAISIAGIRRAFDEDDNCTDSKTKEALEVLAENLDEFLHNYVRPKEILEEMIREGHEPPWTTST